VCIGPIGLQGSGLRPGAHKDVFSLVAVSLLEVQLIALCMLSASWHDKYASEDQMNWFFLYICTCMPMPEPCILIEILVLFLEQHHAEYIFIVGYIASNKID
jgi:hypothetical protein